MNDVKKQPTEIKDIHNQVFEPLQKEIEKVSKKCKDIQASVLIEIIAK